MLNSTITWNGASSDEFNIKIERYPDIIRASRQYDKYSVPGRNGDLYFFRDSYNNYQQSYQVFAGDRTNSNGAQTSWEDIMTWLVPELETPLLDDYINLTLNGYHQLIDSHEPNVIRLAAYTGGVDADNSWNRFGKATLTFDCRPERFTSDAFDWLQPATGFTIINPTDRPAKPIIRLKTNGTNGYIVVNGYRVDIALNDSYQFIYIDSESQNCFRWLGNLNSYVTLTNGFPILKPGNNTITFGGGVFAFSIIPRWWRL